MIRPSGRSTTIVLVAAIAAASFTTGFSVATVSHSQWPARLNWKTSELNWVSLTEFGGQEAIIHRSADGKRVFAAFRESGHATFKYPFDEFGYVSSGSAKVKVHGGPSFTLSQGDAFVFREGMEVELDFSKDFSDLTCLVADHEVKWR